MSRLIPSWTTSLQPQVLLSAITGPGPRRYALILITLLLTICWAGWNSSRRFTSSSTTSTSPTSKSASTWWISESKSKYQSEYPGLIQIKTLNPALLPAKTPRDKPRRSRRRLIVIGDVHGCKIELDKLLGKLLFDPQRDHLIFTGDLINKGSDSLGVLDLARAHDASCVRGNHEEKILNLRREVSETGNAKTDSALHARLSKHDKARELARSLSEEHIRWLEGCPLILKVGQIPTMGEVVVVHAGLEVGVELEDQNPFNVMNVRTVNEVTGEMSSSSDGGTPWAKLFNDQQIRLYKSITTKKNFLFWTTTPDPESQTTTVIYGHDSAASLALTHFTKGIDTGCVKGGKLTAFVIDDGGEQSIVYVDCHRQPS